MLKTNTGVLLVVALIAGIVGAAAALAGQHYMTTTDDQAVAVVNLGALIENAAGEGDIDDQAINKGFAQMKELGAALADKGFIVLDASAVIDAPAHYYVPSPVAKFGNAALERQENTKGEIKQDIKPNKAP